MTDQGFGVVRPLPGDGLVAYLGGLLLVCDPGEATADGLLDALRETAASGGDGRALARRAAQVLAANMAGDPAACAVAGPVTGGVAVLVSGSASASVVTSAGETRLSGSDSLTWADRLVTGTVERVELSLPGAGSPHPAVRLDGGVVHGGGLVSDLADLADRPAGRSSAAPAQSRPLTSEMPATAFHIEADLIQPPAQQQQQHQPQPQPQSQPVERPPYPLADQPPAVPSPPSGPQPVPAAMEQAPYHTPQDQPYPSHDQPYPSQDQPYPSHDQHSPYGPPQDQPPPYPSRESAPSLPEPAHYPSYDEQPPSGNGLPDQQGPPPFGGPEHFGDQPAPPPPLGQPDHFDHPGPPPQQQQEQQQPEHGDRPLVYGVDCKNDHFNDPRVPYCAVCGIALVQRTLVPYKGPRPSLGVLILDDGTALPLESDYLLGRDPERAPEVAGGTARPAKVTSPDGSVSRRHLRVALDGWDVNLVDLGSVNGTQIQPPGDPNFYDIPPNEPVTIAPGTTVRVGVSRTLRYEAHRG
ncbi:FHA domain-containing protein [Nonomuraea wenchangensis]|uniref:FHA domain-containing protein n=1 Tax=Nonomuraea wenchangensis TaxID=568860 RepID=A0A1I0KXM4_9ACTN|nr:FHA domain-containing protein [Nonomuraea wenchangensis]SEU31134.1 FHA domain-containing protein [Nonomuraea wenchangensis]